MHPIRTLWTRDLLRVIELFTQTFIFEPMKVELNGAERMLITMSLKRSIQYYKQRIAKRKKTGEDYSMSEMFLHEYRQLIDKV